MMGRETPEPDTIVWKVWKQLRNFWSYQKLEIWVSCYQQVLLDKNVSGWDKAYRYKGTGNPWAGHMRVQSLSASVMILIISKFWSFGFVLPTGSKQF